MKTEIYRHLKPNGEVFYIGIGKPGRSKSKSDRNPYWHNIVNKYGYEIQILKSDLTWEEACELEKILIAFYGRKELGTGPLVNMTEGGDGRRGSITSDETKAKLSKLAKGKVTSEETKRKMSISNKAGMTEERRERFRQLKLNSSPETRKKLSDARKAWWERKRNEKK